MYLLSSVALLAVITAPATSSSVPTAVVTTTTRRATTIATYLGRKARSLAQEQKQNRRTSDANFEMELFQPEMCPLLSFSEVSDYYEDDEIDMAEFDEDEGFEDFMDSCDIGCDVAKESIVTTCSFSGQEVCDDAGEFCINDMTVTANVPFDYHDVSGEVCMTYTTVPADMSELQGKEGCISIELEFDLTEMFNMAFEGNAEPEDFTDLMEITECGFTLGDEVCVCSVCDDGLGGDLSCPDTGIVSEECAPLKDGMADLDEASEIGDVASSVVRFARVESEGGLRR